jgi:hypothetical protein
LLWNESGIYLCAGKSIKQTGYTNLIKSFAVIGFIIISFIITSFIIISFTIIGFTIIGFIIIGFIIIIFILSYGNYLKLKIKNLKSESFCE